MKENCFLKENSKEYNNRNRKYLLEYIPKRKIGKYMLYFKLSYLSGIACGPLLTLIMSFTKEYGNASIAFPFTHYTSPTWIATVGAVIMLVLIFIFYSEPTKKGFTAFAENTEISREASRGNSFLLDASMTNKESDALKELNDKLFQFNAENNYSDTNQVSQYVDELMDKELGPNGSIQKAFAVIIFEVFLANFIIYSFYCLTPLLFHESLYEEQKEDHNEQKEDHKEESKEKSETNSKCFPAYVSPLSTESENITNSNSLLILYGVSLDSPSAL